MNKKAQVIIISLWVLIILTVLAVGIGHRVSMALRMSRYQRDRLKAVYLAKAGINRAIVIVEIENDETPDYDTLNDNWVDNQEVFEKITFGGKQDEFAAVGYTAEENGEEEIKFGLIDEERKININTAAEKTLTALLEKCEISPAQEVANNILLWRGDREDEQKIYETTMGYPCKSDDFSKIEELKLVKGITNKDYEKLKGLTTIYGDGYINLNTVSDEVLTIFVRGIAKQLLKEEDVADSVVNKIMDLRDSQSFFKTKSEINITLTEDENDIFDELIKDSNTRLQSNNFLLEVTGNIGRIKGRVISVYNRSDKVLLSWYES